MKKWWHDKIVYQIYPKSFFDSNGDGIGDIQGIIQKLDYIKSLGADILWICPMYPSPMADQGYDISDYYNIDPTFGTLDDMDRLISESKKRGMYVIMDLVVNHCSDEHEWFRKACQEPGGKYGKYFYIEDIKDGKLPCNWRGIFGGSVWSELPGHPGKVYLHTFHKKQPDLNWENPKVRQEVYKIINFWLDHGLSGFRVDAIVNIKKKLPFKDYAPDRPDGLCDLTVMKKEVEGIGEFLGEMSDLIFKKRDIFVLGEVSNEREGSLPDYIGENGYFSTMFDFAPNVFGKSEKGRFDYMPVTPDNYRDCCFTSQERAKNIGFFANFIDNHDEPRGINRYLPDHDLSLESKKMLATVYFFLKGIPIIYQGQEIGMENRGVVPLEKIDDFSAIDQYYVSIDAGFSPEEALEIISKYNRDNVRTPMQWNAEPYAGFSSRAPWLEVNPNYPEINVSSELNTPGSVLSYYKKMILLRKNLDYANTFTYGEFIPFHPDIHNLMAYYRSGDKDILIIANYQKDARTIMLSREPKQILLNNYDKFSLSNLELNLLGYQALVLEL